jgi:hypothetical protein
MAHPQDLRDSRHRQAVAVGRSDRLVPLVSQLLGGLVERRLALGEVLGEGGETGSGCGSLAFGTGDGTIV